MGVTLTTMNPIYTPTEIVKQLAISNTKWVVTNKELFPKIKEALEKMGGAESWKGRVIIAGGNPFA